MADKVRKESTLKRVGKYTIIRLITLLITVIVGVYLTILIANMGGYVDELVKAQTKELLTMQLTADVDFRSLPKDQREALLEKKLKLEFERLGLNDPFAIRSLRFLLRSVKLDFGKSSQIISATGSSKVSLIISEQLPATLLLMGTSNLLLFFAAIFIALFLSRRYGSFLDRLFTSMSPLSSMPSWFYGIFLILVFAAVFKILPFSGMVDAPPPDVGSLAYVISVLKHLILPTASLTVSALFASIYSWRTFFMIFSSEDYVDMAKAKGLPSNLIKRRYILRPTLPTIITSFSLMLITMWMGAMVTEKIFQWPGLGSVIHKAIGLYDTAVIVGTTIIYGYLLAITVFLLDFVYALVDPRVKIGAGNRS